VSDEKKFKEMSRKEKWKLLATPIDPKDIVIEKQYPFDSDLGMCLWANFAQRRMLIIRTNDDDVQGLYVELKKYAEYSKVELVIFDSQKLTHEDIEGSFKIVYEDGKPLSEKILPGYFSQPNKMIVVENLNEESDKEVLRAILNVACLGPLGDLNDLPKGKLPKGSGFVFIDLNNFPYIKFDAISSYFREEKWIFEYNTDLQG
jgi:hypothetical protein